ncbi:Stage III sporulation protein AC/AD protein family protein [Caloramator mitchellensis]|uniref:Stage III sporulation protein AC/AD protein family protein n=1 Tax=Caloramator mitchellensis TaxID=908809 RepID=A0A0R3JTJ6_CALMK|nr:stage III sporulation protein AC [Caloramator mitchellensis]KRQ86841.1 Stage III sporulation protein AC/AD protein family protein [Caloramator mitchellensis]
MVDVDIIFKIGLIGILIIILDKIFDSQGKSDMATLTTLAGIVIVLFLTLNMLAKLFDTVKSMFQY